MATEANDLLPERERQMPQRMSVTITLDRWEIEHLLGPTCDARLMMPCAISEPLMARVAEQVRRVGV